MASRHVLIYLDDIQGFNFWGTTPTTYNCMCNELHSAVTFVVECPPPFPTKTKSMRKPPAHIPPHPKPPSLPCKSVSTRSPGAYTPPMITCIMYSNTLTSLMEVAQVHVTQMRDILGLPWVPSSPTCCCWPKSPRIDTLDGAPPCPTSIVLWE